MSKRREQDLLGEIWLNGDVYYGIQTKRARDNFDLSGVQISHFPALVNALAYVKWACAKANSDLGNLSGVKAKAIEDAVKLILAGHYHDQFVTDMIQGGAGTSTNMNANEVIANLGLELLGCAKGEYTHLHPNNDVNMSQSTNDVYPTSVRLSILLQYDNLIETIASLRDAFEVKGKEFEHVLKMGRTQLQDAVPMTLGQEFRSFATTLSEEIERINSASELFKEINLGGTAIGTGINTDPEYSKLAVGYLTELTGIEFKGATDLVEASSDMGVFVLFTGMLKRLSVKLSKICNDLRLLSMGPRCGLNEINLPAQQAGSSIMPGKINPVIPEAMNQVAYQVIGSDLSVTIAAEAGQLQLNAMEPLIAYNVLESIRMMTKAMDMLRTRCIEGITANENRCRELVDQSIGIITAVTPYIGYDNAARIAKSALKDDRNVLDLIVEQNLISAERLNSILKPENMISPQLTKL